MLRLGSTSWLAVPQASQPSACGPVCHKRATHNSPVRAALSVKRGPHTTASAALANSTRPVGERAWQLGQARLLCFLRPYAPHSVHKPTPCASALLRLCLDAAPTTTPLRMLVV